MTKLSVVTIGVYGFSETSFFQSLVNAKIDTFCDIRLRRGMRGSTYSFVNSQYLQSHLSTLGINYVHLKELAPSQEIRDIQKRADKLLDQKKSFRKTLSREFINSYTAQFLHKEVFNRLLDKLGDDAKSIALFCVEKEPVACHRSLVAQYLEHEYGLQITHIMP